MGDFFWRALGIALAAIATPGVGNEAGPVDSVVANYGTRVRPLLEQRCFDCHGDGAAEGGVSLDASDVGDALYSDVGLWERALRSVRAGIMPPDGWERPGEEEVSRLADWVKRDVFRIDYEDPDPGAVTLRRLNRTEYRNTIRDLMGVDYDVDYRFPPDDTGYGFDNNGDVLSVSPLLMEKYLNAATTIVDRAAPMVSTEPPSRTLVGNDFRAEEGRANGRALRLDQAAVVRCDFEAPAAGDYRLEVVVKRTGSFEYDASRATVAFLADGQELLAEEHHWDENVEFRYERPVAWGAGRHALAFDVRPLPPNEKELARAGEFSLIPIDSFSNLEVTRVVVVGPLGPEHRVTPPAYRRFYPRDQAPTDPAERRAYAREVLGRFTRRAFRRPVRDETLDRLVAIAEAGYAPAGRSFERGVADALTAALASSPFLFRHEAPASAGPGVAGAPAPLIDEHSLASRLSYFLWATCPDEELLSLADEGRLREDLPGQVERMLRDRRSRAMLRGFVGQWLRARDVEKTPLNTLAILGLEEEYADIRRRLRARGFKRLPEGEPDPLRDRFLEIRDKMMVLDHGVRTAMRREAEMLFEHVADEDRSLLEMIDCDYAFLNQRLAEYYGIAGVEGGHMRRVVLDEGSVRGGALTQASTLMVTSNPSRTSPVKRGLFILDNFLGTPPPPPPPNIPELEASADQFGDRDPPLRELLALHRESPMCSSCHQRMDPLGLAMENFNALGQWRDTDGDATIEAAGRLISGEEFSDLRELKKILVGPRRLDFYRCVTGKLMTYALGRGVEPRDQHTIDLIVERLDAEGGRFGVLLDGVIGSPAFQRMRRPGPSVAVATSHHQPPEPRP